jgi:hypothetical protein
MATSGSPYGVDASLSPRTATAENPAASRTTAPASCAVVRTLLFRSGPVTDVPVDAGTTGAGAGGRRSKRPTTATRPARIGARTTTEVTRTSHQAAVPSANSGTTPRGRRTRAPMASAVKCHSRIVIACRLSANVAPCTDRWRSMASRKGRAATAAPTWATPSATRQMVGGALLASSSPGTPTIDTG